MRTVFSLLGFATLLAVGACVTDPVTGDSHFSLVDWTPEEELALGREEAPNVESEYDGPLADLEAHEALGKIVGEIMAHSPRRGDLEPRLRILNSSIPNAFALPGGFVYITRGLLQELEDEASFVFVMGHELGHVEHQHSMRSMSRNAISALPMAPLRLIATGIFGREETPLIDLAGGVLSAPSRIVGLQFDRDEELEADLRGLAYARTLGFDPNDCLALFDVYARLGASAGGASLATLFSTHPSDERRIAELRAAIAGGSVGDRTSSPEYQAVVRALSERKGAFETHDRALERAAAANPGEPAFEEAVALVERAIEEDPEEPLFRVTAGEFHVMQERFDDARRQLTAAFELYESSGVGGGHWKVPLYLGVLDALDGDAEGAIEQLEAAKVLYPRQPIIDQLLVAVREGTTGS